MSSWVRYSVAVYLGLLLAGSVAAPLPHQSDGATYLGHATPHTAAWPGPVRADALPHHLDPGFDRFWLLPAEPCGSGCDSDHHPDQSIP